MIHAAMIIIRSPQGLAATARRNARVPLIGNIGGPATMRDLEIETLRTVTPVISGLSSVPGDG